MLKRILVIVIASLTLTGLAVASERVVSSTVDAAKRDASVAAIGICPGATGPTGVTGSTGPCPTGPTGPSPTPPPGGGAVANLGVAKAVSPTSLEVGGTATFTLTVTNQGPNSATNIVLTDPLPAGLGLTGQAPAGCIVANDVLTCSLASLPNQGVWTITFTVLATVEGDSTNTVSVRSAVRDPSSADNTASASLTVGPEGGTNLSLDGGRRRAKVRLNGSLTSTQPTCDVASKHIRIYAAKKRGHLGNVVANIRTGSEGSYSVVLKIKNKRFYTASFKGGMKCDPAVSHQIKVTGAD
jgi:uncharacterized repeat protein (TIGR01451 family)